MIPIFLGVDGGGTKTSFLLLDGEGQILARHEETTSYHIQVGIEGLRKVLENGVSAVLAKTALNADRITRAFFGLPAHGEDSRVQAELDGLPWPILKHDRYSCGNDMVCAWAGSLGCADGINIVAGTGSIGYGECGSNSARAGGWGELFGDEGSAYWIAIEGLRRFSRMADGRSSKGPLYEIIRAKFAIDQDLDLSGLLTGNGVAGRDTIAEISTAVARAAELHDVSALRIFGTAAAELADVVAAIADALPFPDGNSISVSYSGGVFNAGSCILTPLKLALTHARPNFVLMPPKFDPTLGAALYAAKLSGTADMSMLVHTLQAAAPR